jgi:hypothetical protein
VRNLRQIERNPVPTTTTLTDTKSAASAAAAAAHDSGATLVLIDLENICGPSADARTVTKRLRQLRAETRIPADAHVVCAGNAPLLFHAASELPGSRMLVAHGRRNEADLSLIACAEERLGAGARGGTRFARVVIASGDRIFTRVSDLAHRVGAAVAVAGPTGHTSGLLADSADTVTQLRRPSLPRLAA